MVGMEITEEEFMRGGRHLVGFTTKAETGKGIARDMNELRGPWLAAPAQWRSRISSHGQRWIPLQVSWCVLGAHSTDQLQRVLGGSAVL